MAYIGKTPTAVPLTSSDIASDIINSTHIGDTAISGFDALATAPADTDEFLISDAGVLKRLDASLVGGGGKVLQVVSATDTTQRTTTSTSFVTASNTLSVDITPSATSSKILILVSSMIYISQQYKWLEVTIFRGGSNILSSNGGSAIYGGADNGGSVSINYLDSPNSTSQQTYDVRFRTSGSSATAYLNYSNSTGSIVALEIGA